MDNNKMSPEDKIKKNVLDRINSKEIRMKPKSVFIFKFVALVFVLALIFITSSFLISYIIFSLKISGQLFLLGFGIKGLKAFLQLFPWVTFLLDLLLLITLDWLLRQFEFAYQRPALYLFLGIFVPVFLIGYILNSISIHGIILNNVKGNQPKIFTAYYKDLKDRRQGDGIFRCVVISTDASSFVCKHDDFDSDAKDSTEEVIFTPNDGDASKLVRLGEDVFVAGDRVSGGIRAYGIVQMAGN